MIVRLSTLSLSGQQFSFWRIPVRPELVEGCMGFDKLSPSGKFRTRNAN
jgi:hypothetical protein